MNITAVKITDPDPGSRECLLAYASVEIENLIVIKDLKIIKRTDGTYLVDFPSVPVPDRCQNCSRKVECVAHYCGYCGNRHSPWQATDTNPDGSKRRLYANVAHPLNPIGRRLFHEAVVEAYEKHKEDQNESAH